jgi:GPH family glycoside/pentoside/hexuronide:cation symporter
VKEAENSTKEANDIDRARISLAEKLGYASGDVAFSVYWNLFAIYLLYFYTDVFGLSAAAAGTLFLITRAWDSLSTPLMGIVADRTHSRWGKFRPWLLWGSLPLCVLCVLGFSTPDLSTTGKLVYAYSTYLLMVTLFTLTNIPYSALLGVITPNTHERNLISSYRFVGAFAGALLVQLSLLPLVNFFGREDLQWGFSSALMVYGLLAMGLFAVTFLLTRERVYSRPQPVSVRRDLKDLIRNKPWLILFAVSFLTMTYFSMRHSSTLYYFKYYVGNASLSTLFLAGGSLFMILGTLLTQTLVRHFGKARLFTGLLLADGLLMGTFYFAKPDDYILIFSLHFAAMLFVGPSIAMIWAMYGDTADYSEWRTRRRATALVYSAAVFAQKMGAAIGAALVGWALSYFHFKPNVDQAPETLEGIRRVISLYPSALSFLAAAAVAFYPLEPAVMEKIERKLTLRKSKHR